MIPVHSILLLLLISLCSIECKFRAKNVVHAVNCGGEFLKDSFGISYQMDENEVGTPSDYGKQFLIFSRVSETDSVLYQTERYHSESFGYDVPLEGDGSYVLVLKFSEVYFNSPNSKVFDIVLNGHHLVVSRLDIYAKAGRAVAHDEYIPFTVSDGKFVVNDEDSDLEGEFFRVDFVKGPHDNPKINAFYLYKGNLEDVPKLPPLPVDPSRDPETPEEPFQEEDEAPASREKISSGPRAPNPYDDESSLLWPILIAIACVVPLSLCLWKLG